MLRAQILEPDACFIKIVEKRGDASALAPRVISVDELLAPLREGEAVTVELRWLPDGEDLEIPF